MCQGKGKAMNEFLRDGSVLGNRFVLDADTYVKHIHPDYFRDSPPGQYRGLKRIQFTGGFWGMTSAMSRFPNEQLTIICLSNNGEINAIRKVKEIADVLLVDKLEPLPPKKQNVFVEVAEADLKDKVGVYRWAAAR